MRARVVSTLVLAASVIGCNSQSTGVTLTSVPTAVDFGTVGNSADFATRGATIFNRGARAARIVDVKTSCGCAVAALSGATIPAGGSIALTVRLATAGREGETANDVRVEVDGGPDLTVPVRARIVRDIWADPSSISIGRSGASYKCSLAVHSRDAKLDFAPANCPVGLVVSRASRGADDSGEVLKFNVRIAAGSNAEQIALRPVGRPSLPPLVIPIVRSLLSPPARQVRPFRTAIGSVTRGSSHSLPLFGDAHTLGRLSAKATGSVVHAAGITKSPADDARAILRVQVDDNAGYGPFSAQIVLTDNVTGLAVGQLQLMGDIVPATAGSANSGRSVRD